MIPNNKCASACRYCRFYHPEGRRGGMCEQLNVSVQGSWKSCSLAVPAFRDSWEVVPEIALLEKSFSLGCATPSMQDGPRLQKSIQDTITATPEKTEVEQLKVS